MVSISKATLATRRLVVAVAAVVCIATGACRDNENDTQLRVEDFEFKLLPGGARIVSGTVYNDGDKPISVAQVQISLFDGENRRVDGMFAVVRDLPAKGSASFREAVQSDFDVSAARVRSVLLLDN